MDEDVRLRARAEWRRYWPLPLAGACGMASTGLIAHAMGPLMIPLQAEFGWTRAQISSGMAVCSLGTVFFLTPMGVLIDRWGPRRVGLFGVLLMPGAFALLGTATGTLANWLTLWGGMAFAALWVSGATWTTAVASRFDSGRGMAVALTISGGALSLVILPPLVTALTLSFGWRLACLATGAIIAPILFIIIYFFFHGAHEDREASVAGIASEPELLPGVGLREALRMRSLYALLLAAAAFSFAIIGTIIHIVPIMVNLGETAVTAAWLASIAGVASIVGRLGTGALLDRFPGHVVGAAAYLLPIIGCLLLLSVGTSFAAQVGAAIIFGLSMGAELDVVLYLATRHFGMRHIGTMLGAVTSAGGAGMATGPLVASAIYDRFGSYGPFLLVTIALMLVSALALLSLRQSPVFAAHH